MKILKILLAVVLLFSCVSIFALPPDFLNNGSNSAQSAQKKDQKCTVTIIISNDEPITKKVESGITVIDDFLRPYIPASPKDGKVFCGWEIDGSGLSDKKIIVGDVTVKARWKNQADVIAEQDSLLWERSIKSKVQELIGADTPPQEEPKGELLPYLLLGFAVILSVISLLLSILLPKRNQKQLRDNVIEVVKGSDRLRNWRDEGKVSVQSTVVPNNSYDSDIRDLRRRVAELEDKLRNYTREMLSTGGGAPIPSSQGNKPASSQRYLYADSIVNDKFNRVRESPSEDSIFELRLKGDSKATVTIYKPAYHKVLANASYLEGCEKQMIGNTSVNIAQEGEAVKDESGKWKVVNRLKVVLR